MNTGEKLRRIIKMKYRTLAECSEKLDINYTQLSRYLNGHNMSAEFLQKIIEEFGDIDLNWLLKDEYTTLGVINESKSSYKIPKKNEEIISEIEDLLKELKRQLPQ